MSNEDILNARLANQVIANLGEMELSKAKTEQASQLRQQLRASQAASSESQQISQQQQLNLQNLTFKNRKLTQEVEFYKNLLAKPMAEIASQNESFKETYRIERELLASWMVSQKAFKELAVDLGIQLGKSKEEIVKEGLENKFKVLNNQTKHGFNAEDSSIITPHIETLKNKNL